MNFEKIILCNSIDIAKVLKIDTAKKLEFSAIEIDSRRINKGNLFLALDGQKMDGHDFVNDAINNGADGIVISKDINIKSNDIIVYKVKDVYNSMIDMAKETRNRICNIKNSNVIAITGSSGKTSTKEMLKTAIGNISSVYANKDSFNNHTGVPYSLINMPLEAKYGIFELGMNHSNEIRTLSKLVRPNVVIITNISDAHIGNFDSLDGIVEAKSEIFEGLVSGGTVILNKDFSHYRKTKNIAKKCGVKNFITFGTNNDANIRLINREQLIDGQRLEVDAYGKKYFYKINFNGIHQAINSLSILASLSLLDLDIKFGLEALSDTFLPSGRGNKYVLSNSTENLILVDDSYNANPNSVKAAVNLLKEIAKDKRKILILGEMKELGQYSEQLHLSVIDIIIENEIDVVMLVGDKTKCIYDNLKNKIKCLWQKSSKLLVDSDYTGLIFPGDYILVKGSRSMSMELIVKNLKKIYPPIQEGM